MVRNQQFKMMVSSQEDYRISKTAQLMGISKSDVMRMAFSEFEKKVQRETVADPKPQQEQAVTA